MSYLQVSLVRAVLLWLNDESEELDAVGRVHFERQLRAL
jgi:hypothetical protein